MRMGYVAGAMAVSLCAGWFGHHFLMPAPLPEVKVQTGAWGMPRQRPRSIQAQETVRADVSLMQLMQIAARYKGSKVMELQLFVSPGGEPPALYVGIEGSTTHDEYLLPDLECCHDAVRPPLLARR